MYSCSFCINTNTTSCIFDLSQCCKQQCIHLIQYLQTTLVAISDNTLDKNYWHCIYVLNWIIWHIKFHINIIINSVAEYLFIDCIMEIIKSDIGLKDIFQICASCIDQHTLSRQSICICRFIKRKLNSEKRKKHISVVIE